MLSLEKEMCSISLSARILSFGKDFHCGQGSVLSARIFCLVLFSELSARILSFWKDWCPEDLCSEDVCSEQGF